MRECRRIYRIGSLTINEFNRVMSIIGDRLDEREGYRGKAKIRNTLKYLDINKTILHSFGGPYLEFPAKPAETVIPPSPWSPPNHPYLIGWYKFDEGSGLVAANSATDGSSGGGLLPDMTVYNASGNFWTYLLGFASTPSDVVLGVTEYAYASFTPRTIGPASMGVFFRMIPIPLHNRSQKYLCKVSNVVPVRTGLGVFIDKYGTPTDWRTEFHVSALYSATAFEQQLNDTWYFAFYPDDEILRVVFPDGTIISGETSVATGPLTMATMEAGVGEGTGGLGDYGAEASYADWIIYNSYVATLTDWAEWYDELRTRYGMSARSGW